MEYPAVFEPAGEGGFVVTFPDFDWGVTQGESEEDAREMAADALVTMIHEHIRKGEDLPVPGKRGRKKARMIRLPALVSAKAELYREFRRTGMRKSELARRIGISKTNVDRLFDVYYRSRLEQIEAAFLALGKHMAIEIRDAA